MQATPVGSGAKPDRQTIWCIQQLQLKCAALVEAVFVNFPEKKCANLCLNLMSPYFNRRQVNLVVSKYAAAGLDCSSILN